LALAVHRGAVRLAHRLVSSERKFLQSLISATDGLSRMALVNHRYRHRTAGRAPGAEAQVAVGRALVVAFILLLGWSATAAITWHRISISAVSTWTAPPIRWRVST